jgi:hypothetical protein
MHHKKEECICWQLNEKAEHIGIGLAADVAADGLTLTHLRGQEKDQA